MSKDDGSYAKRFYLQRSGSGNMQIALLITMRDLVFAQLGPASQGGCKSGAIASLCTNLPAVVPVVGDATAKAETFLISTVAGDTAGDQANGQILLFLDQSNGLIGGVCRRYYSSTALGGGLEVFDSGWTAWSTNSDGTVKFATDGRLSIDAFQRSTHAGTLTTQSGTTSYQALKL